MSLTRARLQTGLDERCLDRPDTVAQRAVDLAHGKAVAADMADDAGLRHVGGDEYRAADNAVGMKCTGQHAARVEAHKPRAVESAAMFLEIPPRHSVLERHNHGLWTEQRSRVRRRPLERMRLDREHDEVLCAGERRSLDSFHARGLDATILQRSSMPLALIAPSCGPRPMTVTSSPAIASRPAINPPIAPAPKTQIRIVLV